MQKRTFKVLSPIEKRDGGKYWLRLGSAYINKDDSINIYLDALPTNRELQLRELTEEDLQRRASYAERSATPRPGAPSLTNQSDVPF